jgi:hypothetical protein
MAFCNISLTCCRGHLEPRRGAAIPAMHRRGTSMPLDGLAGDSHIPAAYSKDLAAGQLRAHHAWMRLPRVRTKYSAHVQMPTPLVGQSCGATPSPHITPISSPFPGDVRTRTNVPGPLTGDIGQGPDTRARYPGRTPPNSQGKNALIRCVVGWVESGYVKRGAHDTRHLSSCLVTHTCISGQIGEGHGAR